jgi:hypothetical protein
VSFGSNDVIPPTVGTMVTVSYVEPLNPIETVTANSDNETNYYSLTEDQVDICDKKARQKDRP